MSFKFDFLSEVIVLSDTHWTDLDSFITGSSFRRTFSFSILLFSPINVLILNSSSFFSDVNNTKTKADHWDEDSLASFILPDVRYCWISSTSERSPVHSDSGTDWWISLESQWSWSSSWCTQLFSHCYQRCLLLVSLVLVGESEETPLTNPEGTVGKSPDVHFYSVEPHPQPSGAAQIRKHVLMIVMKPVLNFRQQTLFGDLVKCIFVVVCPGEVHI